MSEKNNETTRKTEWTLPTGGKGKPGPGRPKRRKIEGYAKDVTPQEGIRNLQEEAANLARKIVVQSNVLLDRGELKKSEINDLRQLATSFGIFFDKVAKDNDEPIVKIKFPQQVLDALRVGVALVVAPKPQVAQLPAPTGSEVVPAPTVEAESVRVLPDNEGAK